MCFSGSADSTIICWSIPSLDIDPYGPYRKFSKYSIYLFINSCHLLFLSFLFLAFCKKGGGALNGGGEVTNVMFFL